MDKQHCIAHYPFVVVRIRCRVCSRKGSYRLARIAAKDGPEITLRDLLDRFSYDCLWRAKARSKKGKSARGMYLPDLERPASAPICLPVLVVRIRCRVCSRKGSHRLADCVIERDANLPL
jgi:hypothetical protein